MMPACTGPTGISCTPSPSTLTRIVFLLGRPATRRTRRNRAAAETGRSASSRATATGAGRRPRRRRRASRTWRAASGSPPGRSASGRESARPHRAACARAPSGLRRPRRRRGWQKPRRRSRSSLAHSATSRASCSHASRHAVSSCPELTCARCAGTRRGQRGCGTRAEWRDRSSDQPRRAAIPVGEERRNPQAQHQHERRDARTPESSPAACGSALAVVSPNTIGCTFENTAANATPSASEQERRRPRLLAHRRREDQELAREHAERRHAEDRERAEHQVPSRPSG